MTAWLADRLLQYARLARLNRPIGNFLLLWPTLWALWLAARGLPDLLVLLVFVAGVVVMRAAGCVINDFADRHVDGHVKRTTQRPMARGLVSEREALALFAALCLVAFGLVLLLNTLTILLSLVAVVLAATYPFAKRYTHLPQVHLGAAFGWAIPMAFAAQTGAVPTLAWLVFVTAVVWATVYDTEYAMVDRDDDRRIGVKSTAILFGERDRLIIGILQAVMTLLLVAVGLQADLGWLYYAFLLLATLAFVYQQWLIRERDRDACFRAFLNNNIYGGVVFAGIVTHYVWAAA
ncbi:MAG: 4-hydroxybenzoate octaprenyltransferase [Ectothiorhodospiraceae bacterium]